MKGFIPYFLFVLTFAGYSQTLVDSLRSQIDLTDNPQRKVDLLNALAFELFDYSMEDAYQTASQSLKQSRRINYRKGEGWALIYYGMYYQLSGRPSQSLPFQKQAFAIATAIGDVDLQNYSTLQIGKVFRDIGYFDSAQLYFNRAETIQLKQPNPYNLYRTYSAISKMLLLNGKNEKGLEYALKGLEQAKILNDKQWIGYAWIDLGDAYRNLFNFDKAFECYSIAQNEYGSFSWVGTDLNGSLGIALMMKGDLEDAFESLSKVMRAYETYQGKQTLCRTLIRMGEILEAKGLYDVSHEYLDRALKIAEASGYLFLAAEAYYELGWVYFHSNLLREAEQSVRRAKRNYETVHYHVQVGACYNIMGRIQLAQKRYDSALSYYQIGLRMREDFGNPASISSSLYNLGELYLEQNRLSEALEYFNKGIKLNERTKNKYGSGLYHGRLGVIYTAQNDFNQAELHLNMSINLAKQTSSMDILSTAYSNYSTLLEKKGDFKKALQFRKLFESIHDSIYSRGTAQSLASYRILYDIASKDQQIEILSKDKQIQEDNIKNKNLIIAWVGSISFVLMVLVYGFYHYSKKQKHLNRDLYEKNEEIQSQSEELQEANNALQKLNDEVNRQREEIKSQAEELLISNDAIARINEGLEKIVEQRTTDLRRAYQELDIFFYRSSHDFRRPLTTLMGLCEVGKLSVKDQSAIELFDKVNSTALNLDKMLMKLQSISDVGSHQLVHKEVMLKQIIDNELDNLKDVIRNKEIRVEVDVNLQKAFISYPVLIKIIVENLIENAIDFSTPDNPVIHVSATSDNGSVLMKFKDNGEGIKDSIKPQVFDMFFRGSVRSAGNGLGLYIARKAAEKASGKITFENNPNSGTTFTVEIPNNKILG